MPEELPESDAPNCAAPATLHQESVHNSFLTTANDHAAAGATTNDLSEDKPMDKSGTEPLHSTSDLHDSSLPVHHQGNSAVDISRNEGDSSMPPGMTDDSLAISEGAVQRHLQDVESSFIPPISPIPTHNAEGVDDTYLFDRTAAAKADSGHLLTHQPDEQYDISHDSNAQEQSSLGPPEMPSALSSSISHMNDAGDDSLQSLTQHVMAEQPVTSTTPPTASRENFEDSSLTGSSKLSQTQDPDSPSAAAHARSMTRAASLANGKRSSRQMSTRQPSIFSQLQNRGGTEDSFTTRAAASQQAENPDDASSLRHFASDATLRQGNNGSSLLRSQRSKYLKSRHHSHHSSVSSHADLEHDYEGERGNGGREDVTSSILHGGNSLGQHERPVPSSGLLERRSTGSNIAGTRSASSSSLLSGLGDANETPRVRREHDEASARESHGEMENDQMLVTPKPKTNLSPAPTDTVIARCVRDVQVPESLAREYKTKRDLKTSRHKSHDLSFGTERKSKHMTLKEQSTTLDRLSKENFDLKLKVVFLNEKLGQLSEEGIKDMVKENVDLKTALAIAQRDNKYLRRRAKQLAKQLKEAGEQQPTSRKSVAGSDDESDDGERDEELMYLRERIDEYSAEIERLKEENLSKEVEKRRMADTLKTMSERPGDLSAQEESDVWKDLLEQETARREQVDDENRKLRDEIFRLKQVSLGHVASVSNVPLRKGRPGSGSRPTTAQSEHDTGTTTASSTLVDELQRDRDRLTHEVTELRREINAQASLLTSRNREKDRLYQEIEDLKLAHRRQGGGGPAPSTVDTLLERSASRTGRPSSQSCASGPSAILEEAEREAYEMREAELRDMVNDLRLKNQNLQGECNSCMNELETALEDKRHLEEYLNGLQAELEAAENDLVALQKERDEALEEVEAINVEFERLRQEAQEEIDALEDQEDQYKEEIQNLDADLKEKTLDLNALQAKMREMSEAINQIEDKMDETNRRNEKLQQELDECNQEVEQLEASLRDANDKTQRLNVQQENHQVEIGFLRDEQENHIMKIGNLETALSGAQQALHDEKERTKELENRLDSERKQRELVANREKEEVQQFVNELNLEASTAKDEARKLRKLLTQKEVETTEWKERLHELEQNLRVALGDLNGTRSSLLKSIEKLQRELENTVRELENAKASLLEKDRIIKQRDALLESHGLESKRYSDLLEKERQAHRNTKHQFETFQKTHNHVTVRASSQEGRINELESTRAHDRRKIAQLEQQFREQLIDRNALLLELWSRLSRVCGSDWAHNNSLINGRALPSLDSLATMLPGFTKNIIAAVHVIENMVAESQARIKGVERDLWKEYQTLENQLEFRVKRVDRLEALVRNSITNGTLGGATDARVSKLEEAYRQLKVENATLKAAQDARARSGYSHGADGGSPAPSIPTGPSKSNSRRPQPEGRSSTTRSAAGGYGLGGGSTDVSPTRRSDVDPQSSIRSSIPGSSVSGTADNRWMFRLRDLEYKLKVEREARNLDRAAARQRLAQQSEETEHLRAEVVRLKRSGGNLDGDESR